MATSPIPHYVDPVSLTAVNGTLGNVSVTKVGNLVSGCIQIVGLTASAYSWLNLCKINVPPNADAFAHAFMNNDGSYCGIVRFRSGQEMAHIYPIKEINNASINFIFSYRAG